MVIRDPRLRWVTSMEDKTLTKMGVSKNNGTPKSSIFIRFFIIDHPFWGTPSFGNIQIESPW